MSTEPPEVEWRPLVEALAQAYQRLSAEVTEWQAHRNEQQVSLSVRS